MAQRNAVLFLVTVAIGVTVSACSSSDDPAEDVAESTGESLTENLVYNGTFSAAGSNATLAAGWHFEKHNGTPMRSSMANRLAGGGWGIVINGSNSVEVGSIESRVIPVSAGKKYRVRAYTRNLGTTEGGSLEINFVGASDYVDVVPSSYTSAWKSVSREFVAPPRATGLTIRLIGTPSSSDNWDDVSLVVVPDVPCTSHCPL